MNPPSIDHSLSVDTPLQKSPKRRAQGVIRRGARWAMAALMSAVLLTGGAYVAIQHDGNFAEVEPGLMYRSAQLSGQKLDEVATAYGIKTVINLRGQNIGRVWYDEEVSALRGTGVLHRDIRLSAYKELTVSQMNDIVKVIDQSPKPVLVHCESGADRTGLVAAIYRVSRGRDLRLAQQELSLRHGHAPYLFSKSGAMDRSLAAFVASKRPPSLPSSTQR